MKFKIGDKVIIRGYGDNTPRVLMRGGNDKLKVVVHDTELFFDESGYRKVMSDIPMQLEHATQKSPTVFIPLYAISCVDRDTRTFNWIGVRRSGNTSHMYTILPFELKYQPPVADFLARGIYVSNDEKYLQRLSQGSNMLIRHIGNDCIDNWCNERDEESIRVFAIENKIDEFESAISTLENTISECSEKLLLTKQRYSEYKRENPHPADVGGSGAYGAWTFEDTLRDVANVAEMNRGNDYE